MGESRRRRLSILRPRTQNLLDRRPRHAQIPVYPLDRTALTIMAPPNLPDLVRSKRPPPRSPESNKEQLYASSNGGQP